MDVSHIGWGPLGEGLPNVVVSELTYAEDINLLYAGTYGRSAYSIDLEQLFTSTGSVKNAKWSVYPTLVMDKIHVDSSVKLTEEHSMRLISITGEVLHEGKLNEMHGLDYSGLKKGVLILEVYEGSNRIHVERLIKL